MSAVIKKYLSNIPIEFLVLPLGYCFFTVVMLFLAQASQPDAQAELLSWQIKYISLAVFILLLSFATTALISEAVKKRQPLGDNLYKIYKAIYGVVGAITIFFLSISTLFATFGVYSLVDGDRTKTMSLYHGILDTTFGVPSLLTELVPLTIKYPSIYLFIDITYMQLVPLIILMIPILLAFYTDAGRRYVTALSITMLISAPTWLTFPTIAPGQIAIGSTFESFEESKNIPIYTTIERLHHEYSGSAWDNRLSELIIFWDNITLQGFGYTISNNPSTHVSWGIILLWYLFQARSWLRFIILPIIVGEVIGTILLAQHYAIDIPTGALVGIISIYLTSKMFKFEKKHMHVLQDQWYSYFYLIKKYFFLLLDYKKLLAILKNKTR